VTGVRVVGGELALEGARIHDNYGALLAGGLSAEDATITADAETLIRENTTSGSGGGVSLVRSSFEGAAARIDANDAYVHAGGVRLEDSTLSGVDMYGNRALNRGGAFYVRGESTIRGVYGASNSAGRGGGLYVATGRTTLVDTTLVVNIASMDGGNVYVESGEVVWDCAAIDYDGTLHLGVGEANRFGVDLAYQPGSTVTLDRVAWGLPGAFEPPPTNACLVDPVADIPVRRPDGSQVCDLVFGATAARCDDDGCREVE
jgi:hypothetical protein